MQTELSDINSILEQETPLMSEKGILSLDARDRWAMLNEENIGNYSKEQQAIIRRTIQNLEQKDPNALEKIKDAAELSERINSSKGLYSLLLNNSDLLDIYMQTREEAWARDTRAMRVNSEIMQYYNDIENAYHDYKNGDVSKNVLKVAVVSRSTDFLKAYIQDHPEQRDELEPLIGLEEVVENAVYNYRNTTEEGSVMRGQMDSIITDMVRNTDNKEDTIAYLEGLLDAEGLNAETKRQVNNILNSLENIGYLRDATVKKNKEEQLKQQEEQEKNRKEAKKKEKEAKDAAVEAARKAREKKEKEDELPKEEDLGDPLWSTDDEVAAPKEESKPALTPEQELYSQLETWAKEIGITLHNKAEMDAFLKEHGVNDV